MKKLTTLLTFLLVVVLTTSAQVTRTYTGVTPGMLSSLVAGDEAIVNKIVVSGDVNDDDVKVLAAMAKNNKLVDIDLSGCTAYVSVPNNMFADAVNLKAISFSDKLQKIGDNAFKSCKSLVAFDFTKYPELNHLGKYAFSYTNIQLLDLRACTQMKSLSDGVFSYCKPELGYVEFYLPNDIEDVGNYAFENTALIALDLINLPKLKRLGDSSFNMAVHMTLSNCPELEEVNSAIWGSRLLIAYIINCPKIEAIDFSTSREYLNTLEVVNSGWFGGIPDGAFKNFTQLNTVTFSNIDAITEIGANAFTGCRGTNVIDLSGLDSLKTIGVEAFYGSLADCEIKLPTSIVEIKARALKNNLGVKAIGKGSFPNLKVIGEAAFQGCRNLTNVELPDGVEDIATNAFSGANIYELTLPRNIGSIGDYAFSYNSSLWRVNFPNVSQLISVGSYAFAGCTSLETVSIAGAKQLNSVGQGLFHSCTKLNQISLTDGSISFLKLGGNKGIFNGCTNLKTINLSNNVIASVDGQMFSSAPFISTVFLNNCIGLKSIDMQGMQNLELVTLYNVDELTSINFKGCKALKSLDLSDYKSITEIKDGAFEGCESLDKLDLYQASITSIGTSAFDGCKSLSSSYQFDNLESLGGSAFAGCESLKSLNLSKSAALKRIESQSFINCSGLNNISLPVSIEFIGMSAFENCESLENVKFEGLTNLQSVGYGSFKNSGLKIVDLSKSRKLIQLGNSAFSDCSNLTTLSLPENLSTISDYAFARCLSLTNVNLFECKSLKILGDGVFKDCTSLVNVNLGVENSYLNSIGIACFSGCTSLKSIDLSFIKNIQSLRPNCFSDCISLEDVKFPQHFAYMTIEVFSGCVSLKSVDLLSSGLEQIWDNNFKGCSNLVDIKLPSTMYFIQSSMGIEFDSPKDSKLTVYVEKVERWALTDASFSQSYYDNTTLYVPFGTKAAYQTAIGWRNFHKIEEMEPSSINSDQSGVDVPVIGGHGEVVVTAENPQQVDVYTLQGVKVLSQTVDGGTFTIPLSEGVYVVRIGNASYKVQVK